jgi:hypothetical protein
LDAIGSVSARLSVVMRLGSDSNRRPMPHACTAYSTHSNLAEDSKTPPVRTLEASSLAGAAT